MAAVRSGKAVVVLGAAAGLTLGAWVWLGGSLPGAVAPEFPIRGEGAVAELLRQAVTDSPYWAIVRDVRERLPESRRSLVLEVASERATSELPSGPDVMYIAGAYQPGSATVTLRVVEAAGGAEVFADARRESLPSGVTVHGGEDPQGAAFRAAERAALSVQVPLAACAILREIPETAAQAAAALGRDWETDPGAGVFAACLEALGPAAQPVVPAIADQPGRWTPEILRALGSVRGAAALELLRRGLASPEYRVPEAAAEGLARLGPEGAAAVPDLLALLRAEEPGGAFAAAAKAMVAIAPEHPDLAPALVARLRGEAGEASLEALRALGSRAAAAVPHLLEALAGRTPRAAYALAAVGQGHPDAVLALAAALGSEDSETQYAAGEALAGLGGDEVFHAMVDRLGRESTDYEVAAGAACVLGSFNPATVDAAAPLEQALIAGGIDSRVRAASARALVRLAGAGSEPARRALNAALENPEPRVREALVAGWAAPGTEDPVSEDPARRVALLRLFRLDPSENVRYLAMKALIEIAPEDPDFQAGLVDRLMTDESVLLLVPVIVRLGEKGNSLVPRLVPLLDHTDLTRRLGAIEMLSAIGAGRPEVVRGLIGRLQDPEACVRRVAAEALGAVGAAAGDAVPSLERLAQDPFDFVQEAARKALESIREER